MRTRFSSHPFSRPTRPVSAVAAPESVLNAPQQTRARWNTTRRLTLALAASAPLCAGALLAGPAQAAPTVESDENGPLVQIVKPGYNDVLKGKYRILIQVKARKYNPQSVEMFIDDKSATSGPMEISSFASSSYDFDTRLMSDGRHKLTVRVTDSQGFRGWSEVTVFVNNKGVIDTQTPDLRWVGVEPFQEISGAVKLEVNAADNFGVKMLQISISPADTPSKPAYSWMMNQPPYSVNFDTVGKGIPDGLYVLKSLAFDSLDQQGEAPPVTIGIVNNQINATRVQDMLEGKRQMEQVLQGQKPTASAAQPKLANPEPAPEAPARVLAVPAATPAAPQRLAPESTVAEKSTPAVAAMPADNVDSARISTPTTQERSVPAFSTNSTRPNYNGSLPALNVAPQAKANPGIQLPRIETRATEPRPVPQIATPAPEAVAANGATSEVLPVKDETRIAKTTPEEIAPEKGAPTETSTTETTPSVVVKVEPTRLAAAPSRPVGLRNSGEASMSHAAAVELALTPASGAVIERARTSEPISVARFSQPELAGRNVTGAPAWSQHSAPDESRLSNAELSRVRAGRTRILNSASPISARVAETKKARALQISAPTLGQRPVLSRAVTTDSVSAPASKLTREAQNTPLAPQKTSNSGTLSKAVATGQRLSPIAPKTLDNQGATAATGATKPKVASAPQQKVPLELAPEFMAKNAAAASVAAPQMSALSAPRMSDSASGLGVPSRSARLAQQSPAPQPESRKSLNGERVAAMPRPGAATRNRSGASIVAVPLDAPLEISDATATPIPTSYRAERNTTLRAVAARFGLPVELVALSNGWAPDMKVLSGMEVKLPRPLQISYNGVPVTGDAPSMLMGDTAVTAFRFMFEKTGGKMEWDAKNQRVIARKDGREVTLTIGSNVAKVGDREVMMEIAAFLFQGRTMVPLRLFEEGLNAQVEWNPQTGRLVVAMAG